MSGAYKKVARNVTLTFWERMYIPEILRGLFITSRHFFPNFLSTAVAYFSGIPSDRKIMTIYYPEEKPVLPEAYRGKPVLVVGKDGSEKCVACGLCEVACPPKCITISGGLREDGTRHPLTYTLNGALCIFCGFCEEACPEEAIVMSDRYEGLCEYDRSKMLYDKESLLVAETKLTKRLQYIRKRMYGKWNY